MNTEAVVYSVIGINGMMFNNEYYEVMPYIGAVNASLSDDRELYRERFIEAKRRRLPSRDCFRKIVFLY